MEMKHMTSLGAGSSRPSYDVSYRHVWGLNFELYNTDLMFNVE